MKIVLASEVFPPKAGGAGWSTRALALALAEAGHEVRVVTTADGPANTNRMSARSFSNPAACSRLCTPCHGRCDPLNRTTVVSGVAPHARRRDSLLRPG